MSKLYIKTSLAETLLEVDSSKDVISAYEDIKERFPDIGLSVFGAKDISSLRRSHRTLDTSQILKTAPAFIAELHHSLIYFVQRITVV